MSNLNHFKLDHPIFSWASTLSWQNSDSWEVHTTVIAKEGKLRQLGNANLLDG